MSSCRSCEVCAASDSFSGLGCPTPPHQTKKHDVPQAFRADRQEGGEHHSAEEVIVVGVGSARLKWRNTVFGDPEYL